MKRFICGSLIGLMTALPLLAQSGAPSSMGSMNDSLDTSKTGGSSMTEERMEESTTTTTTPSSAETEAGTKKKKKSSTTTTTDEVQMQEDHPAKRSGTTEDVESTDY